MPSPGPKINSSLQQILDVSNRMGLFLPDTSPIQPMDSSGYTPINATPSAIHPSLNVGQQQQLSQYNMQQGQENLRKHNNTMTALMGGLSFIDQAIPQQKSKKPIVRPLESYNPNSYGSGSQAIAKNGIYIKPSHRGLFTSEATQHHMGVQEFASRVLSHKDQFSSAVVKRANFARNFGGKKAEDGLTLYTGDPEDPKKPGTYKTQKEVDAANESARSMARRQNLINPNEYYVAKKPGDPIVQYMDINTGKPYNKPVQQMPQSMIKPLPDSVSELQWSPDWQMPYYLDDNGNINYVDKHWYNDPRFIKSRQEQDQIIAMRSNKMKNGGKMKKGYKCENGMQLMEGQSYDLDENTIKQLLEKGYELDFE